MRVFLGWAEDEARDVALALKEWLPLVCPGLQPWISDDITKGKRWSAEIATTLRGSKAGIFVLTPDNLSSVWLHYEAGAISNVEGALVCTFLRRVGRAAVKAPLDVFQHTTAGDEKDTRKLVLNLEALLPREERLWGEAQLRSAFDKFWGDLVSKLDAIKPPKDGAAPPTLKSDDMLAEILDIVRGLDADTGRRSMIERLGERYYATESRELKPRPPTVPPPSFIEEILAEERARRPAGPPPPPLGMMPPDTEKG
jgi:hypothetical protein